MDCVCFCVMSNLLKYCQCPLVCCMCMYVLMLGQVVHNYHEKKQCALSNAMSVVRQELKSKAWRYCMLSLAMPLITLIIQS